MSKEEYPMMSDVDKIVDKVLCLKRKYIGEIGGNRCVLDHTEIMFINATKEMCDILVLFYKRKDVNPFDIIQFSHYVHKLLALCIGCNEKKEIFDIVDFMLIITKMIENYVSLKRKLIEKQVSDHLLRSADDISTIEEGYYFN
ncbi:hypothetical protein EIN_325990 [Entamoeba invadens IP1]|uniref:Uncharacterized protein n=1 Tax=Entamoeba invadens IP1 TaxID=370355 RepID=L7FKW1_ENTIV|nr:hypothetical protein EIN_325990 [Entamoeba invadens IP1]ELP87548.1 hypothetical protein EIN_325990 [Entamoeba invadens IP1]|eukprot:XP_004254319.1 hypothetical protein EIN_325990 [Entamoeba invadens IP1]